MPIFRIHWQASGKTDVCDLNAASDSDARIAFNAYRVKGVSVVKIERLHDDGSAVPVTANNPDSPFNPLKSHRLLDKEDDAR